MRTFKCSLLAMMVVLIVSSGFTYIKDWVLIGQKEANFGTDRDVLEVKGNNIFTAVKLKVVDAGLNVLDFNIYFKNGEKMNVPIQKNFQQGEESRVIDLPGNKRRIDKIEFLYDTKGFANGKANILVFGRK